jgi:hypothetical protein
MAEKVNTGMEKQEMKRLLAQTKQSKSPISCAIGMLTKQPALGLFLADKVKGPKAVEQGLTKAIPDAANTRFGTALVDTEDDPKKVKITINRAVSGMAKRLVKTFKGTGITKVQILLEDGTAVDAYEEADETDEQEAQSEDTTATQQQVPPPPPPPQPQQQGPDAGQLAHQLAELVKRIPAVVAVAPGHKDALTKLATDANAQIKTNNLSYARVAITQLAQALEAAARDAAGNRAQNQPSPNGQQQPNGQQTTAPEGTAGAVAYGKARLAWLAARQKVEGDVDKLRSEITATYQADGIAPQLEQAYRQTVAPMMEAFDESLADMLDEATNATDPNKRAELVGKAKAKMQEYSQYLANEKLIGDLDSNPFVPIAIRQTIGGTLAVLEKTVR